MSDAVGKPCELHASNMRGVIVLALLLGTAWAQEQLEEDNYADDYAGNNADDKTKDIDTPDVASADVSVSRSVARHHKHSKRHKYWKATVEFLKKTLNPNTLMQNAWFTEMLRKFSHSEDTHEEVMSEESEEVHTIPVPTKRRRGRPRKGNVSLEMAGLRGIFRKGLKKISTIDKRKLKRQIRMMKRMAKKAKRPLKSAVKFYLSSKNNNNNFGNNYGNNNY